MRKKLAYLELNDIMKGNSKPTLKKHTQQFRVKKKKKQSLKGFPPVSGLVGCAPDGLEKTVGIQKRRSKHSSSLLGFSPKAKRGERLKRTVGENVCAYETKGTTPAALEFSCGIC